MKFIISAGGTGGHIMPAISIAQELKKRGHTILFIGNKNSMEEQICYKNNIVFKKINVQKLYRKITIKHVLFPFKLYSSIMKVKRIFRSYKPDAFIGTGGFVSGPSGYVAKSKKIPYFLQEQNSYPGLTTRMLEKEANRIFIGQANATKHLSNTRVTHSGNPINKSLIESSRKADFSEYQFSPVKKNIFVIGGSQGSLFLNNAIDLVVDKLLEKYNIIWQLGSKTYEYFYSKHKDKPGLLMFSFSYEIDALYNSADIAISRAGAITIAELESKKIPAILIPLATAAENHQYMNAIEQSNKKIAITIEQKHLSEDRLLDSIDELFENLVDIKSHFLKCVHESSVNTICDSILKELKSRG